MTAALGRIATYRPVIVWGTGTVLDTSAYDTVSRYYLNTPGLRVDGIGRDQIRAYAPPKAPSFDLTLSNHDGTFSPGGPLQNFLGRGPQTYLEVAYGTDVLTDATDVLVDADDQLVDGTTTFRLFDGTAISMPQKIDNPASVQVTALGSTATLLVGKKPITTLYQSITTDAAITAILDWCGWDAAKRTVSTGSTTLLYWWLNGQTTAIAAINALLAAEGAGACAYEDGNGYFHYEGRTFRDTNPHSAETQWVFSDGVSSGDAIVDDEHFLVDATDVLVDGPLVAPLFHVVPAQYTSNPDEVVAAVTATVNVRTATATQKIWEYGTTLTLTASQVLDIEVTSSDPFRSAVTPVAATDYSVSAGSLVSVVLLSTSGQTIVSRWTAGAAGATILGVTSNGPQVRAVSLPVTSALPVNSTVSTSSTDRTQAQDPLVLGLWPEIERNGALDTVNSFALRYRRERRQVVFQTVNIDAAHMYAILNMRISDRVQFIHSRAELNIVAWIEQLTYTIAPGGGLITLTVGCEQVFDLNAGLFDTAKYDIDVFGVG